VIRRCAPRRASPSLARFEVEPGDELCLQVFYREEDAPEAYAQDAQYGQLYSLKTFRNSMAPLTVQGMRDGILRHAKAAARRLRDS
jgi:transcription termination/antitermination protein NusA